MDISRYNKASKTFNNLSFRERILIFILMLIGLLSIVNYWILEPALRSQNVIEKEISTNITQLAELNTDIEKRNLQLKEEPLDLINEKILHLQKKLRYASKGLDPKLLRFFKPSKMPIVLNQILSPNEKINIDSVKTFKVEQSRFFNDRNASNSLKAIFYKQIIKIKLRGDLHSIYNYLVKLESLAEPFYFESFEYQTLTGTNAMAVIQIYRFSDKRELLTNSK